MQTPVRPRAAHPLRLDEGLRGFAGLLLTGLVATACGSSFSSSTPDAGYDGGGSASDASLEGGSGGDLDSGSLKDAATNDAPASDGGCVNPTVGEACTAADTVCPDGISPCCRSYVWTCDASSHTWVQGPNQLGCACVTGFACGSTMCSSGQVCVAETISGGACLLPDDAGACPNGTTHWGPCCSNISTSYTCATRPAGCGSTLTCSCASSLCSVAGGCQTASGNQLGCSVAAP
jgi:hypothetical protein